MLKMIKKFVRDEEGAVAIEYALLAALIALAIVVGAGLLGTNLNTFFTDIANFLAGVGIPGQAAPPAAGG